MTELVTPGSDGTGFDASPGDDGWSPSLTQSVRAGAGSVVTQAARDVVNNYGKVLRDMSLSSSLADVEVCFAAPPAPQWEQLVSVWRASRLVVVTGDRHVGKRAAALRLLSRTDIAETVDTKVRELVADWEKPDAGMLPKGTAATYLLDLGEVTAQQFPERFGAELVSYIEAEQRVRLVVTMTSGSWARCGEGTTGVHAPLSSPPAAEVVRAHLRLGKSERVGWVDHSAIEELLTVRTLPRDAVRLSAAIEHAPEQPIRSADEPDKAPGGPSDEAVEMVIDEYRAWRGFLRGFFGDGEMSVVDRALLIAAALLQGAEPVIVWRAAMQLLKGYEVSDRASDLLAGEDLDTQLARITGADASDLYHGVSLDSVRHGLSAAVLPHVWRQRPQMKDALVGWIRMVSAASDAELPTIGRRLGELAVASGDFDVVDVLRSWVDGTPGRQGLVARLLTGMAEQDGAMASVVRAKTWSWAYAYKDKGVSAATAELAARICATDFMRRYPNACLVRLKWLLAGPWTPVIDGLVGGQLRRMAAGDEAEGVLRAVLEWHSDSGFAAARAFMALMDPADTAGPFKVLIARAAEDDRLASLLGREWEHVAAQPTLRELAVTLLRRWIVAACEDVVVEEPVHMILSRFFRRMSRGSLLGEVLRIDDERGGLSPDALSRMAVAMVRWSAE